MSAIVNFLASGEGGREGEKEGEKEEGREGELMCSIKF